MTRFSFGRGYRRGLGVLVLALLFACAQADDLPSGLIKKMSASAPGIDHQVLHMAVQASRCAIRHGVAKPQRLAVIDFSRPSSEERLWIFDARSGELLLRDLVAHGRNSGNVLPTRFSNIEGSHQSSLGLFRAEESYVGKHGYALRLEGLEPGINDLARRRAIVIHGADYVSDDWVARYGRIGRSHGCPAVDRRVVTQVVDSLKGGQLVFKFYPDADWLDTSVLLRCGDAQVAGSSPESSVSG